MPILDDLGHYSKVDPNNLFESISAFPEQFKETWLDICGMEIPTNVKNIVVSGMGGSALAARILKALYKDNILIPIDIVNHYELPKFVNENTLTIISSYSGNTEETVSSLSDAINKNSKIVALSCGGEIEKRSLEKGIPHYKYLTELNPSKQPRMGLGMSIAAILYIFNQFSLAKLSNSNIEETYIFLKELSADYDRKNEEKINKMKTLAIDLYQKQISFVASEHLVGSSYSAKNQINENAKTYAECFELPELNHHLMEGLKFPGSIKNSLAFLFIESSLYSERISRLYPITQDVVEKNNIKLFKYNSIGKNKLSQSLEVVMMGMYLAYYLAILKETDPTPIPWVDYFKSKLK